MHVRSLDIINKNSGTVLLLAMIFMLMLALVSTTVLQTTILQLRMAGNNQFLEEAFYKAQAVVAELSQRPANFSLDADVGHANCPAHFQDISCDLFQLEAPVSTAIPEGVEFDYRVIRQAPLLWKGFPVRESQDSASSSGSFDAAIFEIVVRIDGSATGVGTAHIAQGIAMRVAALH
jgi:hypothetical protein